MERQGRAIFKLASGQTFQNKSTTNGRDETRIKKLHPLLNNLLLHLDQLTLQQIRVLSPRLGFDPGKHAKFCHYERYQHPVVACK